MRRARRSRPWRVREAFSAEPRSGKWRRREIRQEELSEIAFPWTDYVRTVGVSGRFETPITKSQPFRSDLVSGTELNRRHEVFNPDTARRNGADSFGEWAGAQGRVPDL